MSTIAEANHRAALDRCAGAVMDVALLVSRLVRATTWRTRGAGLSDVQFRALTLVNAYPDCTPSALADYMLLSRPAVTRVLDELAEQKLITRQTAADDRRRTNLRVTAAGRRRVESHLALARTALADRLAALAPRDRDTVTRAMELVIPCVEPARLGEGTEGDGELS